MTKIKVILSALAFSICGITQIFSQAPVVNNVAADPIVSTIDSLITIDNVVRFRAANLLQSSVSKDVYDVPVFTDEIYRTRISQMNSPIPYTYNDMVKAYINVYAVQKREGTKRIMGLSAIYLPMFEEVLEREHLPLELKYLAMVESALNPTAVSPVGATGLWQFMYNTGTLYNLNVNSYIDDRRDPYKSTVAACEYFKRMYEIYHDWLLVIASYNCGPGNVNKAIIRAGGKSDFWSIAPYLPAETRGYVPAFMAISYVMTYSREHNLIPVPPSITYFETDTVHVTSSTSFSTLSKSLDVPMDVLSFLNPTFKKQVIPCSKGECRALRLPRDKIIAFTQKQMEMEMLDEIQARQIPIINLGNGRTNVILQEEEAKYTYVTKTVKKQYVVRRGETLARIADKFDLSQGEIKSWNKLRAGRVARGQRLTLYVDQKVKVLKADAPPTQVESVASVTETQKDSKPVITTSATKNPLQVVTKTRKISYLTRRGDSLGSIARKMNCSVAELKQWNKLKKNTIHPNQTLYVYRDVKEVMDPSRPTKIELSTAGIDGTDSLIEDVINNEKALAAVEKEELQVTPKKGKKQVSPSQASKPSYLYYTVRKGDTLYSIAKRKGTTIEDIKKFNNISSGKQLRQGLRLKVRIIG